jgi:penicillin-binding protein 1A
MSIAEAAELAAMIRAPSAYDPRRQPDRARVHRDEALARMVDRGYITSQQARAAAGAPVLDAAPGAAAGCR